MRHDSRRREERPQREAERFDWRPGERVDGPLRRLRSLAVRDHPPDDQREHRRARCYGENAQRLNKPGAASPGYAQSKIGQFPARPRSCAGLGGRWCTKPHGGRSRRLRRSC